MLRLLIDTSVWLDWAKDHRQKRFIETVAELVRAEIIEIVLPQVVVDEFARNKERVIEESGKSLASVIKRAREAVDQLGNSRWKKTTVLELNDLEHKLKTSKTGVNDSIDMIEAIFKVSTTVVTTDDVLLKASKRAVEGKAPFHKQKNSIADAILIEIYAATLGGASTEMPYVFVTHNTRDFSSIGGDQRLPHIDLSTLFDNKKSFYSINLLETVKGLLPDAVTDFTDLDDFNMEPKDLGDLIAAEHELFEKVWYNRHLGLM
jgi:predicted nucleic acid-binding protein